MAERFGAGVHEISQIVTESSKWYTNVIWIIFRVGTRPSASLRNTANLLLKNWELGSFSLGGARSCVTEEVCLGLRNACLHGRAEERPSEKLRTLDQGEPEEIAGKGKKGEGGSPLPLG